jgi:hypothetical protein
VQFKKLERMIWGNTVLIVGLLKGLEYLG